jgi:signal transduction histidine kinase/DNA-binding LytR/AlgR family response regulator
MSAQPNDDFSYHLAPGGNARRKNCDENLAAEGETSLRPRILIIDDAQTIHEDFRKILVAPPLQSEEMAQLEAAVLGSCARPQHRTGFVIDSAFEGSQGLARLQEAASKGVPYAVAFVDVRMPTGWDGIETAARLRQADPDLQIVICSSYSDYSWEEITARIGNGDGLLVLKKPFDTHEVLQLAEALNQKWLLARDARMHLADLDEILTQRTQVLKERTRELGTVHQSLAQEMAQRSQIQSRMAALAALGHRFNKAQTSEEIFSLVIDAADQLAGWQECHLYFYSPGTEMLAHALGARRTAPGTSAIATEIASRPPSPFERRAIDEGAQREDMSDPGDKGAVSTLCVPIRDGEGVVGLITLHSARPDAYDSASQYLIQALADFCGGALDRAKMRTHLTRITDLEHTLEKLHKQLAQATRQAGLAEVATGVLHNVGNVLNSVNVSANVLAEIMRDSKVPGLKAIVSLLGEHNADLGAFFTSDPKGRQLPRYLEHLSDLLTSQHSAAATELTSLLKNVEHIKNVIAVQQNYAKLAGVIETVTAQDLIEDALNLHSGALRRHHVTVVRDYDTHNPKVTVDRHKVLQVLVNLIGNAKYACDESARNDKQVTLRVRNGGQRISFSVEDNGVGIPVESLERIFTLGFTTRKNGHGFGLHNCAQAAREMGGTLGVHSDGPNRGAIFKLELPLHPQTN